MDRAVQAAREVFERGDWSQASPAQRKAVLNKLADLMERHGEELALLETLDTGKPIRHSLRDDIPGAARAIRWYAEAADKVYGEVAPTGPGELAMIVREPIGVVAAIVPWNFPLLLACWKLGPALIAGNSVVLKPSEKSPLTALRLAGLAKEAGLPDGVLNVISGYGHEAGQALALHPEVEVLTFTGSTRTGKQLLKDAGESNMKRVWLEAGGKSANIIFADCPDLNKAVSATAAGIFYNQGQVCIAGTRLLLEDSIADDFLAKLKAQAVTGSRAIRSTPTARWECSSTLRTPIPSTRLFAREPGKVRCCWTGGNSHGLPQSVPPFLSTSTQPPRCAGRRFLGRCWSSPVLKPKKKP